MEEELFQRIDQERLEARHQWKVWVVVIAMVAVCWTLMIYVHIAVGIITFFLFLYLSKDFNPIPEDERYKD